MEPKSISQSTARPRVQGETELGRERRELLALLGAEKAERLLLAAVRVVPAASRDAAAAPGAGALHGHVRLRIHRRRLGSGRGRLGGGRGGLGAGEERSGGGGGGGGIHRGRASWEGLAHAVPTAERGRGGNHSSLDEVKKFIFFRLSFGPVDLRSGLWENSREDVG